MVDGNETNALWFEMLGTALCLKNTIPSLSKEKVYEELKKRHVYLADFELFNDAWNKLKIGALI